MDNVTFYAGEELEFKTGRIKYDMSLDEAIKYYKYIIDTYHTGIPGIGINVNDEEWDILSGKAIMESDLKYVPDIKNNPATIQAIEKLKKVFPDYEVL